jgi:hypothetical protein
MWLLVFRSFAPFLGYIVFEVEVCAVRSNRGIELLPYECRDRESEKSEGANEPDKLETKDGCSSMILDMVLHFQE